MKLSRLPIVGKWLARRDQRLITEALASHRQAIIDEDESIQRIEVPLDLVRNCRVLPSREDLLTELPKGGTWLEVGTADGEFAAFILETNRPDRLHLVDSWSDEHDRDYAGMRASVEARFTGQNVQIHQGFSLDILPSLPPNHFDVIYLDAGHGAETLDELEACLTLVKPDGWLCGHDYCTGTWQSSERYQVKESLHRAMKKHRWELLWLTLEMHGHYSWAIKRSL